MYFFAFLLAALLAVAALALAAAPSPARETEALVLRQPLPDVPGKTLAMVLVHYPPGAASSPHRHGDASVYAYVLTGAVRSQLEGSPARTYRAGETWSEPPGAHHTVSENASETEPASLLAVFVADEGATLTVRDSPGKSP